MELMISVGRVRTRALIVLSLYLPNEGAFSYLIRRPFFLSRLFASSHICVAFYHLHFICLSFLAGSLTDGRGPQPGFRKLIDGGSRRSSSPNRRTDDSPYLARTIGGTLCGLPPDLVDDLLAVYFTHVHVGCARVIRLSSR